MRRNRETAALVDGVADFPGRFAFQIRKLGTDAEKVAIGGGHFDAGQNEETIDRLTVETHQTFFEQISDRVTGVVIRNGDAVQTFGARRRDQIFRTGDTITREKRVAMQIEIERHFGQRSLAATKWKAWDSRDGRFVCEALGRGLQSLER